MIACCEIDNRSDIFEGERMTSLQSSDYIFCHPLLHLWGLTRCIFEVGVRHLWPETCFSETLLWGTRKQVCLRKIPEMLIGKAGLPLKDVKNEAQRCHVRKIKDVYIEKSKMYILKIKDVKPNIQRCHKKSGNSKRTLCLVMAGISAFCGAKAHLYILAFCWCTGNILVVPNGASARSYHDLHVCHPGRRTVFPYHSRAHFTIVLHVFSLERKTTMLLWKSDSWQQKGIVLWTKRNQSIHILMMEN